MKRLLTIITLCLYVSPEVLANVTFDKKNDKFSNGVVSTISIVSNTSDGMNGTLFISCHRGEQVSIQLGSTRTMFPDEAMPNAEGMLISTTYKFKEAGKAITSDWFMNIMKYKNAWYRGNAKRFITQAMGSTQLYVRLNKRSDIYSFPLTKAHKYLKELDEACSQG